MVINIQILNFKIINAVSLLQSGYSPNFKFCNSLRILFVLLMHDVCNLPIGMISFCNLLTNCIALAS